LIGDHPDPDQDRVRIIEDQDWDRIIGDPDLVQDLVKIIEGGTRKRKKTRRTSRVMIHIQVNKTFSILFVFEDNGFLDNF
jgi:hypothetical protein